MHNVVLVSLNDSNKTDLCFRFKKNSKKRKEGNNKIRLSFVFFAFLFPGFMFFDDFSLQIWDLRAGRLLSELREHTAAVNEVVFHPHEFLLASGAADRRVLFWDLENFTLVSNSEPETSGIR